jgi:hypothetical protein
MCLLLPLGLDLRPESTHHYTMRMLIRDFDGSVRVAMLLAAIGRHIRVALPGCGDAVEYQWTGGQWRGDDGVPVEIEFDPSEEAFDLRWRRFDSAPAAETPAAIGPLWHSAAAPAPGCPGCIN